MAVQGDRDKRGRGEGYRWTNRDVWELRFLARFYSLRLKVGLDGLYESILGLGLLTKVGLL